MTYKTELTIVMKFNETVFSPRAGQLDWIFSIGLVEKCHWCQVIVELYRSQMRTKWCRILLPRPLKVYCSIDV